MEITLNHVGLVGLFISSVTQRPPFSFMETLCLTLWGHQRYGTIALDLRLLVWISVCLYETDESGGTVSFSYVSCLESFYESTLITVEYFQIQSIQTMHKNFLYEIFEYVDKLEVSIIFLSMTIILIY